MSVSFRNKCLPPLLLVTLTAITLLSFLPSSGFAEATETEVIPVSIYVVCLDGVEAAGVNNMSRMFEGVSSASRIDRIPYWTGEWEPEGMIFVPLMHSVPINASVSVVTDWDTYESIIVSQSYKEIIIVNAHGEILPVPSGYDKSDWVSAIAWAVLTRGYTWVHTGGYPFYYFWDEDNGFKESWGVSGFSEFMSYINKGDVDCLAPIGETTYAGLTEGATYQLEASYDDMPNSVQLGKPLKEADFKDYLVMSLYEYTYNDEKYYAGAIITFAKSDVECDFGFYVHLGGGQTYGSGQLRSRDLDVGYVGCAAAVWIYTLKSESLKAIREAQVAMTKAEIEGRSKGLDEARWLIKEVEDTYNSKHFPVGRKGIITLAQKAKNVADGAMKPSLLETYGYLFAFLAIASTGTFGVFLLKKRNSKRLQPQRTGMKT